MDKLGRDITDPSDKLGRKIILEKITHVKPAMYSYFFYELRVIAFKYGYNLVLHGSMNRDLDLIAIPWHKVLGDTELMVKEFADFLKGEIMLMTQDQQKCFPHGRISYVINMNRGGAWNKGKDEEYYIDISVIPSPQAHHEAKLKEELIKFAKWFNGHVEPAIACGDKLSDVDEYLKQRNNG